MKFLYCLASSEKDIYLEQFLCSVTSLRYYNENTFVALLVDDLTAKSLTGFRASIKDMVDEFKIIEYPKEMPLRNRSRQLKTSMRNLIDGDFLYIDCDTVICDKISQNELPNCEIGAVMDAHISFEKYVQLDFFWGLLPKHIKAGFVYPSNNKYFNSGVLYVKDTQFTRDFFKYWQKLQLMYASNGLVVDQPALSQTNAKFNYPIMELNGVWNCMFDFDINYIHNAKIMHFFSSGMSDTFMSRIHPLREGRFYKKIKNKQKIAEESLRIILNPKENFYPNIMLLYYQQPEFWLQATIKCIIFIRYKIPLLFRLLECFCAIALKIKKALKR